jgi:outer membrane lipopolysaccharide assembly protein LptE/RlpB
MPRRISLLVLSALVMACAGCGVYSATSGRVDDTVRYVHMPYLENMSTEPGIEIELTDAITAALQEDNTLKVVNEDDASSLLSGKVLRYNLRPAFTTSELQVDEYQVQILVELSFVVNETGEKLIDKKRVTGTGNYILDDPGDSSEESARAQAAAEIVRAVLAAIVEDW